MLFGLKFFPEFCLQRFIQYPLVVLLSILLPVSFWLRIQSGKKLYALIFVGIFFLDVTALAFALEKNFAAQRYLEKSAGKGIVPEIAEFLSSDENLEKSRIAARLIYQSHAVSMPFRTAEKGFTLYEPSQQDKEAYRTNFARNTGIVVAGMNAMEQMLTSFFLLILHAGLFLAGKFLEGAVEFLEHSPRVRVVGDGFLGLLVAGNGGVVGKHLAQFLGRVHDLLRINCHWFSLSGPPI